MNSLGYTNALALIIKYPSRNKTLKLTCLHSVVQHGFLYPSIYPAPKEKKNKVKNKKTKIGRSKTVAPVRGACVLKTA